MDRISHLRIFLASPGDVVDERAMALKIIGDLPYDPSFRGTVSLEVVAWDHIGGPPMEANLTPQDAIARGLPLPSECDIFVAVFWARLGTPLQVDGKHYLSGTHFEYVDALRGNQKSGRPRVLVYRRTKDPLLNPKDVSFDENLIQYRKVEDFFSSFVDSDTGHVTGGYNEYRSHNRFRELLSKDLRFVITELLDGRPNRSVEGFYGTASQEHLLALCANVRETNS